MLERAILLFPARIRENLDRVRDHRLVPETPNEWQIALGVLRMWHRVLFRSETIGTSAAPIRDRRRARLMAHRWLRFPFLVRERAIAPLDFSGLASSPERIIRHLLGAHHDGYQFVYDLALLSVHEGKLAELETRARAVVDGTDPRAEWLRDLVVFERYHEALLRQVEAYRAGDTELPASVQHDPDISFLGYLEWCARQPRTPAETLAAARRGAYTVADGLIPDTPRPAPSARPLVAAVP